MSIFLKHFHDSQISWGKKASDRGLLVLPRRQNQEQGWSLGHSNTDIVIKKKKALKTHGIRVNEDRRRERDRSALSAAEAFGVSELQFNTE